MKKFFLQTIILIVLIYGVDKLLLSWMNNLPEKLEDQRMVDLLDGNIESKGILIGSSKAFYGLSAETLSDSIISYYNLGIKGSNAPFHELIFDLIRKKGIQKLVIGIDDDSYLENNKVLVYRMDLLYPLVKHDTINSIVNRFHNKSDILSELLVSYRCSENMPHKFYETLDHPNLVVNSFGDPFNQQFIQKKRELNILEDFDLNKQDSIYLSAFRSIIQQCESENIALTVAIMPNYGYKNTGFQKFIQSLHNDVFVIEDSIIQNPSYFQDLGHLNSKGAKLFSKNLKDHLLR